MGGCDWDKPSFTIRMPTEAKNKSFDRSCGNCANKKTKSCKDCHHWSNFKREMQRM